MCKMLKVSTSGYYNWLKSKVSKLWLYNQKLSELITTIFNDSFKSYGAPALQSLLTQRNNQKRKVKIVLKKVLLKSMIL